MKKMIMIMAGILFLVPLVTAHAIERGSQIQSTQDFNIQFSMEPKFPIVGKETHLDFIIKNKDNLPLSGSDIKIELHNEEKTVTLDLYEKQKGYFSINYNFVESGNYEINIIIDGEELDTEFYLEVDTMGLNGILKIGVVVILLLILSILMYKDCRENKK